MAKALDFLKPRVVDLAGDNHRSPNGGILLFADAVMKNISIPSPCADVTQHNYPPKGFEPTVHAAVIWMFSQLAKLDVQSISESQGRKTDDRRADPQQSAGL